MCHWDLYLLVGWLAQQTLIYNSVVAQAQAQAPGLEELGHQLVLQCPSWSRNNQPKTVTTSICR